MPHGFKSEFRTCKGCGCCYLHYVGFDVDTEFCGGCHDKPCPTCTGNLSWMIVQGEKMLWCQSCGAFDVFKEVKPIETIDEVNKPEESKRCTNRQGCCGSN